MKAARDAREGQQGFTLVELMISLAIFSFAMAGILAVATTMNQGFREQRNAIATEGQVRGSIDYMSDALRQVSPAVPGLNITDADTCTTSALTITNSTTGPDALDIIFASGAVVTSSTTVLDGAATGITVNDASQLAVGDSVVVSNLSQGHLFQITAKAGNVLTFSLTCGTMNLPSGGYAAGSLVVRAQHAKFTIAALDGANALWMEPNTGHSPAVLEPLAEGVEDMQIAVGIDQGVDGVTEDGSTSDEWIYNNSGDTAVTIPPASGTVRAVRITLVAKSPVADIGGTAVYTRPAIEDRSAGTADNYRRRVLRSMIEIRNVGVSP